MGMRGQGAPIRGGKGRARVQTTNPCKESSENLRVRRNWTRDPQTWQATKDRLKDPPAMDVQSAYTSLQNHVLRHSTLDGRRADIWPNGQRPTPFPCESRMDDVRR